MAYDDNPDDQTTFWTNYTLVPSSFGTAGDTGLTTGKAYIAFRVEDMDSLTEAQANEATGSCKQIVFATVKEFYDWYSGLATADKPDKLTIGQQSMGNATTPTNMSIRHTLDTDHAASTTVADE